MASAHPHRVSIRVVDGRPCVFRGDTRVPLIAYSNVIVRPSWGEWVSHFLRSGVNIQIIQPSHTGSWGEWGDTYFWLDEGEFHDAEPADTLWGIDQQAEHILKQTPDAMFLVRWSSFPPSRWRKRNVNELQLDSDGKTYNEASMASDKFLTQMCESIRRFIGAIERRPWGERVLGYMFFTLMGEGLTWLSTEGRFFDRSPVMREKWRAFVRERYADDKALHEAWGDANASLDTIEVPTDDALRRKALTLPQWPDPKSLRMERDYCELQKRLFHRWFTAVFDTILDATKARPALFGVDALKQHLLGWEINEAFFGKAGMEYGHYALSMHAASGSLGVGPLLDHPAMQFVITPADYTNRAMGMAYEGEGVSDSMVLRGKSMFIENDARTYLSCTESPEKTPPMGAFMDDREVTAGLLRNSASVLSRGLMHYWMDVSGGWFNHDDIQKGIREDKRVLEAGYARPHRETEHAIAVVYDDDSPLHENLTRGFQHLAILRQRTEALAFAGIPYRMYLLSDLRRSNFPGYRCYLFPNLYNVSDATLAVIREKCFCDGRISIFGPGTGITDGTKITHEPAEKLLGMPMRIFDRTAGRRVRLRDRSHLALRDARMPALYGDSFPYGPILAPDPARLAGSGVQTLGHAVFTWYVNTAGLALKEFGCGAAGNGQPGERGAGDYATVFSGAIPIPSPLLRSLARYGGCHVWCEDDVVVSASESVASVHVTQAGPMTVRFPRRVGVVTDAQTGAVVGRDVKEVRLEIGQPPVTRVLFLD